MNDKDFAELLACFKEAGQIKDESKEPGRVFKIEPPASKPIRTKIHPAQDHADCAEAARAKASSKKPTSLKDVKKPLGL
jgi:hypothetical protein